MKSTARARKGKKLIQDLVKFLNNDNNDSEDVWNVITALRGPDNADMDLKHGTTARFRTQPIWHFRDHYRRGVKSAKNMGFIKESKEVL